MMKSLFFVYVADLLHPERIPEKGTDRPIAGARMTFVTAPGRYCIAAGFTNS